MFPAMCCWLLVSAFCLSSMNPSLLQEFSYTCCHREGMSASVIMSTGVNKLAELCTICLANPILNALNWSCALASQLYWLVSFRVMCTAFTGLYSNLTHSKQKGAQFKCVFVLRRWIWHVAMKLLISPQLFLVYIVRHGMPFTVSFFFCLLFSL